MHNSHIVYDTPGHELVALEHGIHVYTMTGFLLDEHLFCLGINTVSNGTEAASSLPVEERQL